MRKIIIIIFVTVIMASFACTASAGWVDDWLQQKTVSAPNSLEGQKRGYFTGGSFDARWYTSNDHIFSINRPKFKSGCGGIDAFMGGFSFLNFNYLVQKLQNMLQAAPAIAFDLALQTLSSQASTSLGKFETITDKLNNLQLDDCQAGKAMVATLATGLGDKKLPADYKSALSDFEVSSGYKDLAHAVTQATIANADNANVNIGNAISDGCGPDVKSIFATSGSILDHLGQELNINGDYVALMRGFVGDVQLNPPAPNDTSGLMNTDYVIPCQADTGSAVDNFINGNVQQRYAGQDCASIGDTNANLLQWSEQMMESITNAMNNKSALTAPQVSFLSMVPMPILPSLKYAVSTGQFDSVAMSLSNLIARGYALRMMEDLYHQTMIVVRNGEKVLKIQSTAVPGQPARSCNIALLGGVTDIEKLRQSLLLKMKELHDDYMKYLDEETAIETWSSREQVFNSKAMKDLSDRFSPSIAGRALGQ